jgi:tRNA1Val (adenine37-N6)-methyltransferase
MTIGNSEAETADAILGGVLTIVQPATGYRFSIDAILLAYFARPRNDQRVLELGAGSGVISSIIAKAYQPRSVVALELQPALVDLVRRNAQLNHLDRLSAVCGDLRARELNGVGAASFEYIVANPPYRALGRGRRSPHDGRDIARAELGATLQDFAAAASRFVTDHGAFSMIFPAQRMAELMSELRARQLEPKRLRFIHSYADRPASTFLIEARKNAGIQTVIEAPLSVWEKPGIYSAEAQRILMGSWIDLQTDP